MWSIRGAAFEESLPVKHKNKGKGKKNALETEGTRKIDDKKQKNLLFT